MDEGRVFRYTVDLEKDLNKTILRDLFVTENQNAHTFRLKIVRRGTPVDLSGASVIGYFNRYKTRETVPLADGRIEGSEAVLTLSPACYAERTMFAVMINISIGDLELTVFTGEGQMLANRYDKIDNSDGTIPTLDDLLAQINAMKEATADSRLAAQEARDAADTANQAAENIDEKVAEANAELAGEVGQLSEDIAELQNVCIDKSINLYDATLQTEDTISPHYYVDGFPYETTAFDSSWHCTAPINVEPNTPYFLTLVSDIAESTKPWGDAGQGVFFYRSDHSYISGVTTEAFITPNETAYLRFNYICNGSKKITLNRVNESCMLVVGNTRPTEYVPYFVTTIKDKVATLENAMANSVSPIAYEIVEDSISVVSNYGTKKLEVLLNKHGGNNLFDFKKFSTIEDGVKTEVQTIGTDWHAPFQVKAVNNADGDNTSSGNFTGGNHNYTNSDSAGSPNARTTLLKFFVDGKEVSNGTGYANHIKIVWTNLVQGYNTQRVDGTGREILQENHCLTFDGLTWISEVDLIPLEDIVMRLWYGLQFTGLDASLYPYIRYKGATNRGLYHYDTLSDCGDNTANAMIAFGDTHKLTLGIDREIDLGDSKYYDGTKRFFSTTYGKGYAFIIENQDMYADNIYSLKGYYKFEPVN